jgi:hypothetical protein
LGGRGRWISEFKASLVYRVKFQDSQGYTEKPCLEKTKKKKKKKSCIRLFPALWVSSQNNQEFHPGHQPRLLKTWCQDKLTPQKRLEISHISGVVNSCSFNDPGSIPDT